MKFLISDEGNRKFLSLDSKCADSYFTNFIRRIEKFDVAADRFVVMQPENDFNYYSLHIVIELPLNEITEDVVMKIENFKGKKLFVSINDFRFEETIGDFSFRGEISLISIVKTKLYIEFNSLYYIETPQCIFERKYDYVNRSWGEWKKINIEKEQKTRFSLGIFPEGVYNTNG